MRPSSPSSLTAWQMTAAQRMARAVQGIYDLQAEYTGLDILHAGMHMEVQSGLAINEANPIAEDRILVAASPTWMRWDQIQDLY